VKAEVKGGLAAVPPLVAGPISRRVAGFSYV